MNQIYLKVFAAALIIQGIQSISSAPETQIYPLFTTSKISSKVENTPLKGLKELGNTSTKKLIAIKPAMLRASSLSSLKNSLLKKSHLTLFNKPSSITFLNKKYLPQPLELLFSTSTGSFRSSGKSKQQLPTYQLATPISSSTMGSASPLVDAIGTANLKSTNTDQLQFITKPLFIPIKGIGMRDNSQRLKKQPNSWNPLLNDHSSFNNVNNQLSSTIRTSLPVFVFASEKNRFNQDKFNFEENKKQQLNKKFYDSGDSSEKLNDNSLPTIKLANHRMRNHSPHYSNSIREISFYSNSDDINQTYAMKAVNYNGKQQQLQLVKHPQLLQDFKPIVATGDANGLRVGKTMIFDKGQIRQHSFTNEVKQPPGQQGFKIKSTRLLPGDNTDLEFIDSGMDRNILSKIEKAIKSNNIKFIKSIILPPNELKLDENVKSGNLNNNANHNAKQPSFSSPASPNRLFKPSQSNQLIAENNQISQNSNSKLNLNNNYTSRNKQPNQVKQNDQISYNNHANERFAPNFQQQSAQQMLKLQANSPNENNFERARAKQIDSKNNNQITSLDNDNWLEKSSQNQVKMRRFKIAQLSGKGAIEEFTRALESIDFRSIAQNDLAGLSDLVYDKLGNARIEKIIDNLENTSSQHKNHQSGQQEDGNKFITAKEIKNDYKEKSSGSNIDFQAPLQMEYFGNNDKISLSDCAKNKKLHQMHNNDQQDSGYQGHQQMTQQTNHQQQDLSSQQKFYSNDQSVPLNSLVNFDDQASFYSTSSTKLRPMKLLPNGDQTNAMITISTNDNQFNSINGNLISNNGQTGQMNDQTMNQIDNRMENQMSSSLPSDQFGYTLVSQQQLNHQNLNLNSENESNDDFREESHNEADQMSKGDNKNQPDELDVETNDEFAADQLDDLNGASKNLNSAEEGSSKAVDLLDPTKLDLKIIHLPVSVLKKLVQENGEKQRKR